MKILGIETSCDETAVCIVKAEGGFEAPVFSVLGDALFSQAALHAEYGGVYPNLAKREHQRNLVPLLEKALKEAGMRFVGGKEFSEAEKTTLGELFSHEPELLKQFLVQLPKLAVPDIDAIAVTAGPGLEPALWVGINFANALGIVWEKPVIPINHMEGHVVASLLEPHREHSDILQNVRMFTLGIPAMPAPALLISGGHTELVLMKNWFEYEIIGETLDDAVGEAFDKVARMLGLPYPGGPEISKLAEQVRKAGYASGLTTRISLLGNRFSRAVALRRGSLVRTPSLSLPRPMLKSKDLNFSY